MKTIKIEDLEHEIIDSIEKITIADSFVIKENKIGSGNGEAKLYIGFDDSELISFFGPRGFESECIILKEDLIRYLEETRIEYNAPTQSYINKDALPNLWPARFEEISQLEDVINFKIKDQNQLSGSRIYVNSSDVGYKIIREISLPVISHLNIYKIRQLQTSIIKFYFLLYSDYSENVLEEDEITVDNIEFEPFDPMKISIDTKPVMMETLIRRLQQGTINLNPDFQRNEVWTPQKKGQLIESLMLKIPLPMFYVNIDEDANFNVVDGLQRLSTIRDFILGKKYMISKRESDKGNGIELQQLEFWGSKFNGSTFNDLPINIQNRILETEFTFTIINPGTPEDVKRNIFKRVNRGGEPLTDQEIRHALYVGQSTILIKELTSRKDFLKATNGTIKSNRMLDREFILRSLAFIIRDFNKYPKNGDIDTFLSDTMRLINFMPQFENQKAITFLKNNKIDIDDILVKDIEELKEKFLIAMKRAPLIFGEHTFRKSYYGKRKTPINKALFEVWTTLFSRISEDQFNILVKNKSNFLNEYINSYLNNYTFNEIVSRNALKLTSVVERHTKLATLLNKYII